MIAKKYRLTESQIGKVLRYKKPFFSNVLVANVLDNGLAIPRFALILSGKVAKTSVDRNAYRRKFYDVCGKYLDGAGRDMVFVVKKGNIFSRKDQDQLARFEQEVASLLKQIAKAPISPPRPASGRRPTLPKPPTLP